MVRVVLGRVPTAVRMKLFFGQTQGFIGYFQVDGALDFISDRTFNLMGCRNSIFDYGSLIAKLGFQHPSIDHVNSCLSTAWHFQLAYTWRFNLLVFVSSSPRSNAATYTSVIILVWIATIHRFSVDLDDSSFALNNTKSFF